jgi:hypothetical protein
MLSLKLKAAARHRHAAHGEVDPILPSAMSCPTERNIGNEIQPV